MNTADATLELNVLELAALGDYVAWAAARGDFHQWNEERHQDDPLGHHLGLVFLQLAVRLEEAGTVLAKR